MSYKRLFAPRRRTNDPKRVPVVENFTYTSTEGKVLKGQAAYRAHQADLKRETKYREQEAQKERSGYHYRRASQESSGAEWDEPADPFLPDEDLTPSEAEDNGSYSQRRWWDISFVPKAHATKLSGSNRRPYKTDLQRMTAAWAKILPEVYPCYLDYRRESLNFQAPVDGDSAIDLWDCRKEGSCRLRSREVTFITSERQWKEVFSFCTCTPDPVRLACMGFLAASPVNPATVISFSLLHSIHEIWRKSPFGVEGFVEGIWAIHASRGGVVLALNAYKARDGSTAIRRAIHVYRDLLLREQVMKDNLLRCKEADLMAAKCPLCFGPRREGDLLRSDPDIIIAVDGNFNHSRTETAAKNDFANLCPPIFLEPRFIEKAQLTVGVSRDRVADNCSDAWKAKDGGANPRSFSGKADTGLFGMVCSHEVCLKLINLYKSGERMYYPIALLDFMFTEVAGEDARIGLLYDISCNFEAHLKKRDVFLTEREKGHLKCAVAVFHAYAHNWQCQLRYNPRKIESFGRRDGEGCERLWSKLVKLIRLNRRANASLRLMNLHFKVDEINESARTDLVAWLHRHYKSTNLQLSVACKDLGKAEAAGWTEDRLRVQWAAQRMAQSKEGQADEAERREKRYEELGQMLVQSDEFILALTRLEEALKKDDAETAIREAETAKYLAEKREALKQKIAAKARELVGPNGNENELKSFCRVHQALGVLRQEMITHRMSIAPILKTRGKNSQKESLVSS
uniref:Unplaced genomic scaffold supercont1.69, whole genome shotgun sequence n=1 Tax=Cryptococcus bacillisporus CA1280 TaxID=1296109 RepID=A0A0D0V903_CRYGA|nr:hypothetical protein I312_06807 [Cryptococcus bacillisporus CA1280]